MRFAFILAFGAFLSIFLPPSSSKAFNAFNANQPDEQLMCLALNGYYEARGESPWGELLVNHIVLNRVADGRFGQTICDVIKERASDRSRGCQFEWVCNGGFRRPADLEAFERSLILARALLYAPETVPDLTNGATYFHHRRVKPTWSRVFTRTLSYGSHIFYAERD